MEESIFIVQCMQKKPSLTQVTLPTGERIMKLNKYQPTVLAITLLRNKISGDLVVPHGAAGRALLQQMLGNMVVYQPALWNLNFRDPQVSRALYQHFLNMLVGLEVYLGPKEFESMLEIAYGTAREYIANARSSTRPWFDQARSAIDSNRANIGELTKSTQQLSQSMQQLSQTTQQQIAALAKSQADFQQTASQQIGALAKSQADFQQTASQQIGALVKSQEDMTKNLTAGILENRSMIQDNSTEIASVKNRFRFESSGRTWRGLGHSTRSCGSIGNESTATGIPDPGTQFNNFLHSSRKCCQGYCVCRAKGPAYHHKRQSENPRVESVNEEDSEKEN